jgi:zinc and cadmium transporter
LFWRNNLNLLLQIIAASLIGGLLSMVVAALVMLGMPQRWLTRMVSFSAGLLLAVAFLDVLPEAIELSGDAHTTLNTLLIGILCFFLMEKLALWRHKHEDSDNHHQRAAPLIMVGDAVHNFTDGVLLAAAFLADTALGWSTALAIVAHEIPREAGDFALLLSAGWKKSKALLWNILASLTSVAGGVIGFFTLAHTQQWVPLALTFAGAGFIYIAIADLLPRRERSDFAWHAAFLIAGVTVVAFSAGHTH